MPNLGAFVKYRLGAADVDQVVNLMKATIRGPEDEDWNTRLNTAAPQAGQYLPMLIIIGGTLTVSGLVFLPGHALPTIYVENVSLGVTNGTWAVL